MTVRAERVVDLFCAAIMGAVSGTALVGWVFKMPLLTQVRPTFNPMQFNAVLCFLLLGAGFATLQWAAGRFARILATAVLVLAGLTLLEHITGSAFGIDTWSGYYVDTPLIEHPGRMALGSVYGLLSLGAALWLRATTTPITAARMVVIAITGSIAAAVGLGAVAGFFADIQSPSGWTGFPLVSLPTAVLCLLAGGSLLWNCWRQSPSGADLIPIPLGIGMMTLLFVLNQSLRDGEIAQAQALSQAAAQHMAVSTRDRLSDMSAALDRMTSRWNLAGGVSQAAWESDAKGYLKGYPGLVGIELVDAASHVKWVYPSATDAALIEKRLHDDPRRWKTATKVIATGAAQITTPLALVRGGWGVLYMSALQVDGRKGGLQIAVIRIDSLLADVMARAAVDHYHLSVSAGRDRIFSTMGKPAAVAKATGDAYMTIMGTRWTFSAEPDQDWLAAHQSPLRQIIITAGAIIVILITLATRLALRLRADNRTLQEHEAELRQSEETFRATMESAPVGMALLTPTGKRLGANKALCRMTGYTNEELLVLDPRELMPDYYQRDREQLRRLTAGDIDDYEMEQVFITRDGHSRWVQVNASLARNADGSPKHVVKQFLDITGRKELDRLKSEFISVVSHELRTPLTAIRGALGLLGTAMSSSLPPKALHLVTIAHRNSERLIALVNDILDMEKLAAGQMVFDKRESDLVTLMRQSVESNTPFAEKYGVTFSLQAPDGPLPVVVDPNRIAQIFANLLSNAAKFSHEGAVVKIAVSRIGDRVRADVRDFGDGIPESFRARIFGRFVQADSSSTRAKGGTGLGLHITKEMTERMDGQISFESEVGHGTTFRVEFPLAASNSVAVDIPAETKRLRILVCASDADTAPLLRLALDKEGFGVDVVQTVPAARKALAQDKYAAMILDPLVDGESSRFITEIRATAQTRNLPVLIVSVTADQAHAAFEGSAIQVVDWLPKPVNVVRATEAVRRAVAAGRAGVPRILHVEDDVDLSRILTAALRGRAELVNAASIRQAQDMLARESFSAIVLDVGMPDGNGLSLLEAISAKGAAAPPVIILSAQDICPSAARNVAAALVKSRLKEADIVQILLNLIAEKDTGAKEVML